MLYSCFEQAFGNEENDGGKKIKMIPLNKKKKKKNSGRAELKEGKDTGI